jgi:hypothetical protein
MNRFRNIAIFVCACILLMHVDSYAQVVILQQGFDSTSGSQANGTWTNVDQIQNGGNTWTNQGTGNDVIEGNNSCSGWSTCNDKTGNTYGITGGAPNFKGTGTNVGYLTTNSTYFSIFDIYDASYGSYGGIYTPVFNLTGYTNAHLTFYWNNANTTNSYIQVQYWNGSSWTGATNFGTGTGSLGWHQATMTLPSTATEVVFFIVSDFYYYAVGLDQIEIYATPNCTTPTASISSSTNVSCYGQSTGSATASTNGTSPTYSWSPSGGTNATASGLSAGTYTVTVTVPGGCHNTATVTITQPASALSASISSHTNVSPCSTSTNGTATASASGGTSPYAYSWTPSTGVTGANTASASTMGQGTYTCTVTDAKGCTTTATIVISGPSAVTGSISSQTNVSCNGGNNGSATISASGGTSPYTYSWSPSGGTAATANNLTAGTYTCTIKDINNCTGTVSVTITQPSVLSASISSHTNVLCYGQSTGSATVSASNGTSPYAYSWSPSGGTGTTASNLSAGSYTVTVTDHNGCTTTASVTITQPAFALSASISSHSNAPCNGEDGSATVTASGGVTPYTYSWSPSGGTGSSANVPAGSYTVTVTDHNGCTATASVTITQPADFTGTITTYNICGSGNTGAISVQLTGGTTPYTYSWTPNVTTTDSAGNLSAGSYTVIVNDANGCGPLEGTTTISHITAETVSITSQTNVSCFGGNNGSITASASPTVNYAWSPSGGTNATASSLTAGTYTVTSVESNGCRATASATVTQPPAIRDSISASTNVSCNGGSNGSATVGVKGGTSPYTYSWNTSPVQTNATAASLTAGSYTVTIHDAHSCTSTATVTITQPALLRDSISASTNVSCNGSSSGSATVGVKGGTTPYAYSWSTSPVQTSATATGLSAGSYTVTVTDANSCSHTASVTITQPSLLRDSISASTNESCNGGSSGSATVGVKGGTTPYSYSWNTSPVQTNATATGLSAGSYTVTVTDAHSCTNTATVTITQPSAVTVTLNAAIGMGNVSCNGGNNGYVGAIASGGTSPYTYSWNTSPVQTNATATNLSAGSYTVTATDAHGCTGTYSVTITQPSLLRDSISSSTNVSCNGGNNGSATVGVKGGTAPYTYLWSPSGGTSATASGLSAGTYTVSVNDANSCGPLTATVTITQPGAVTANISSQTNTSCGGGNNGSATVTAGGGTSPYTYSWSNGETTSTATGLSAGTYTVTVKDVNNCSASTTAIITQGSSTISVNATSTPGCGGNNGSATATASGGTSPYTYSWAPGGGTNATASNLSTGTYTVTATDAGGCTGTATVTVTDYSIPTVSVSPPSASINEGNNVSLTATGSSGTAPYTFTWAPPAGLSATVGATVIASPTVTTTYTVTVKDANNVCSSTATVTITVTPSTVQTPTSCDTCIGGLNLIPGKTYLVSVWTKVVSAPAGDTTYTTPELAIVFPPSPPLPYFVPQGRIIDGWQRIEGQFTVPLTATSFNIVLSCTSGQCNFDDIRVFPFNGTLKTYVYDPNTLRLAAVLDERNYATIYEYDEEGKLIRVKKETERGIMTIQESRTSMQKQ